MSSLRTKVTSIGVLIKLHDAIRKGSPWVLAGRTDTAQKHKIELLRFADFIAGVWIRELVLAAKLA